MGKALLIHALEAAIFLAIQDPLYQPVLPNLDTTAWDTFTAAEKDRLEFRGDRHMHACIADLLGVMYPHHTPHFYANVRQTLTTNEAFYRIMVKSGEASPLRGVKSNADEFEAKVAAYKEHYSYDMLYHWVNLIFSPLASAAEVAYKSRLTTIDSESGVHNMDYGGPTPKGTKMASQSSDSSGVSTSSNKPHSGSVKVASASQQENTGQAEIAEKAAVSLLPEDAEPQKDPKRIALESRSFFNGFPFTFKIPFSRQTTATALTAPTAREP